MDAAKIIDAALATTEKMAPLRKALSQVTDALFALDGRLSAIETRPPPPITHEDMLKALRADPDFVRDIVADVIQGLDILVAGPPGPQGETGERGLNGIPGEKGEIGPRGEKGDKGDFGEKGDIGEPGERGETGERGLQGELGPVGEPGAKGDPGEMGEPGETGAPGAQGERGYTGPAGIPGPMGERGHKGESGFGLAGAFVNKQGNLILTLSNGEARDVGPVVGADGNDGFSLEDFSAKYDGERGVVLKFERDGLTREFQFHIPIPVHRGFWRDGGKAKAGDMWTADGSLWIARADTDKKPSYENRADWTMAARRGRDAAAPSAAESAPSKPVTLRDRSNV